MKSLFAFVTLVCTVFTSLQTTAQINRVLIADSAKIVTFEMRDALTAYLEESGVKLVDILDYSQRCTFGRVLLDNEMRGEVSIKIRNCNQEVMGISKLYSEFRLADENTVAKVLSEEIVKILFAGSKEGQEGYEEGLEAPVVNHHDSRYFFAPSAFNLKKGQLYYNTVMFGMHDIQYGGSDHFSIGIGTTVATTPFYITPKYSWSFNDKMHMALGNMLVVGVWNSDFFANLGYSVVTFGDRKSNFSIGVGALNSSVLKRTKPVINFSVLHSFSQRVYIISEHYFSPSIYGSDFSANAVLPSGNMIYDQGRINQSVLCGFLGARFIRKEKDVGSWQVGLAYMNVFKDGKMPNKYDDSWNVHVNSAFGDMNRIVVPMFSYTHKFGKKF